MDDRWSLDRGNIVLAGFMGTGKSTVGRLLAERLGFDFVDTDEMIESRHGSIPAIFAEQGEGRFRELERELAQELSARHGLVIATGGRMMVDAVNAHVLGSTGAVICLTATVDTLVARLTPQLASRPMLAGHEPRERVTQLLAERAPAYARFTPVVTDGRSPGAIADEIIALLGRDNGAHG